jgi:hypothetical protein
VSETVVRGKARRVAFQPAWGGPIVVTVESDPDPDGEEETRDYQVDAARFWLDGRAASQAEAVAWLAGKYPNRAGLPRVILTGHFGPNAYEDCDRAEFFSP